MNILKFYKNFKKSNSINLSFNKLFSTIASQNKIHKAVLLRGDAIGHEISQSVLDIFKSINVPIDWEEYNIQNKVFIEEEDLPKDILDSIIKHKVALKCPITFPSENGNRLFNTSLKKKLKLYANLRPIKSFDGIESPYENVDLVVIRENTEGEYSVLEHEV